MPSGATQTRGDLTERARWFAGFRTWRSAIRGIAEALDRLRDPDEAVLRWFGQAAGRGRPARPTAEARTTVGTLMHECATGGSIADALERLESAGMGTREGLANARAREGELYQLSIGGIWVTADRLMRLPWVGPKAAQMRWDVYRLPA